MSTKPDLFSAPTDINEIIRDRLLPGLNTLLDRDKLKVLINSSIGSSAGEIERCEISYIRYKPSTNCLVAYTLHYPRGDQGDNKQALLYAKIYTKQDHLNAARKAESARQITSSVMNPVIILPDEQAILYFYPNDCLIEGLKILSDPKKIRRYLYECYGKYPETKWRISYRKQKFTTIRYKPERRAVVRYDSIATDRATGEQKQISLYMRFYSDDRGGNVYLLHQRLALILSKEKDLTIPAPIAYLPERRLLLIEAVVGQPLLNHLAALDSLQAIGRTARALAILHEMENADLPYPSVESLPNEVASSADILRHILPQARIQVEKICKGLHDSDYINGTREKCLVHGDFYYGQVLLQDDCAAIMDFDRFHKGDPLADVGNFCAHIKVLRSEKLIGDDSGLESAFIAEYNRASKGKIDGGRLAFWTALGLFRLAVGPFRRMESGWPLKTKKILDLCAETLKRPRHRKN
jgi:aminoglycoside phosphotransferase (APT) family kinase protein